jgi:hypothetical protein
LIQSSPCIVPIALLGTPQRRGQAKRSPQECLRCSNIRQGSFPNPPLEDSLWAGLTGDLCLIHPNARKSRISIVHADRGAAAPLAPPAGDILWAGLTGDLCLIHPNARKSRISIVHADRGGCRPPCTPRWRYPVGRVDRGFKEDHESSGTVPFAMLGTPQRRGQAKRSLQERLRDDGKSIWIGLVRGSCKQGGLPPPLHPPLAISCGQG